MASARVVRLGGREFRVSLARDESGGLFAEVETPEGERRRMEIGTAHQGRILIDGQPLEYRLLRGLGDGLRLQAGGQTWPLEVLSEGESALSSPAGRQSATPGARLRVRAPMPGRVLTVEVAEGEWVPAGAALFILEAMKMENEIRAPREGLVHKLNVTEGDAVEQDQELCELHPQVGGPGRGPATASSPEERRE